MRPSDPEELLWELSLADGDDDGEVPPDELLTAYRAGGLPADEAQRIELQLAHSSAARERLRELAGIAPPAPLASLRSRWLGPAKPARTVGWLAAAALLAVALGLGWYLTGSSAPADLPATLTFDVSLELLAEVRGGSDTGDTGTAFADTPVRIVVEPEDVAVAELEFGLYRRRGAVVERLTDGIDVELRRGTAVFTATAGRLASAESSPSRPGPQELLIAIARTGRLPPSLTLGAGEDAATRLAQSSGGQIYRRTFLLLTASEKDESAN